MCTVCSMAQQELQELLQQQKAACDAMIDEKEKLVNEFQQVRLWSHGLEGRREEG